MTSLWEYTTYIVTTWLNKRNATKWEISSLVGLLQHTAKIVYSGRTFVSHMYTTAAKLKEMHYFTRLNREFRSDLAWWHVFLQSWNGLRLLRCIPTTLPDCTICTDASGSWVVMQVMPDSGSNGSGLLSGPLFQSWLRSWYPLYSVAQYGSCS